MLHVHSNLHQAEHHSPKHGVGAYTSDLEKDDSQSEPSHEAASSSCKTACLKVQTQTRVLPVLPHLL